MNAEVPHRSEPTGADRPLETQKQIESVCSAMRARIDFQRNRRVENPRAVRVHRNAVASRERIHFPHVLERQDCAASAVVRRLHADECRAEVLSARRTNGLCELVEVHGAALAGNRFVECARQTRDAAQLRIEYVSAGFEQHLSAAMRMRKHGDQVRHGAARHERCRLLAEPFRGKRFESRHRFIAVARIIAERGLAHRFEHRFGRARDGVAA